MSDIKILKATECVVGSETSHSAGNSCGIKQTREVLNTTDIPVFVVERSGLKYTVPSVPIGTRVGCVLVRYKYEMSRVMYESVKMELDLVTDDCGLDRVLMKAAFSVDNIVYRFNQVVGTIEYSIPKRDLYENGYYTNLDLVLSTSSDAEHPYSTKSAHDDIVKHDLMMRKDSSFAMNVKLVNNNGYYNSAWINLYGEVKELKGVVDGSLEDGVWIIDTNCTMGSRPTFVSYEDAFSGKGIIYLFNSKYEAETKGDVKFQVSAGIEKELNVLQEKIRKINENEIARNNERELFKHKEDLRTLDVVGKVDEHKRLFERVITKDHFDDRSYIRKDNSETIKLIPTFIAGALALFTGYKAFMT